MASKGEDAKGAVSDMASRLGKIAPQAQDLLNSAKPYIEQAKPYLEKIEPFIRATYPYCSQLKVHATKAYITLLPYYNEEVGAIAMGLVLLFYGGHFAMTIACWQIFRVSGQRMVAKSWAELRSSFAEAYETLQKDAEAKALFDHKGGGAITPSELFEGLKDIAVADTEEAKTKARKKVMLIMKCIDPNKIWEAAMGVFTGLLAVLAALRSRFVQSITIGANIGKKVVEIGMPMVQPKLHEAFPSHIKWVDFLLKASGGVVGAIVALTLARVISAFNSAMEGADILVKYGLQLAERKDLLKGFKPSLEQSRIAIMALTLVGFLGQLRSGFNLPFLLRLPLLPVTTLESILAFLSMRAP